MLSRRVRIGIYILAILFDLAIRAQFDSSWLPLATLALLPAVYSLKVPREALVMSGVAVAILWSGSGINLGIVTLAIGLMYGLAAYVVPALFHPNTWQGKIGIALSPLIAGLLFAAHAAWSTQGGSPVSIGITTLTTTAVSILLLMGRHSYGGRERYETLA